MAHQQSSGSQGFGERPSSNAGRRPQEPRTGDPPSSVPASGHVGQRDSFGRLPGGLPSFPSARDYYGENSPRLHRPGSVPARAERINPRAILSSRSPRSGATSDMGRSLAYARPAPTNSSSTFSRMPSSVEPMSSHRGGRLQEQRNVSQGYNNTNRNFDALKRKRLGENIKPPSTHPWAIAHKRRLDTAASEEPTCCSLQSDCKVSECVQRQSRSALATSSTLNAKSKTAFGGTAFQSDASDNCCAPTLDLTNGNGRRRGNAARQCQVHRHG